MQKYSTTLRLLKRAVSSQTIGRIIFWMMIHKIRELTDRNKGISNEEREKKYQEYVRGWVEYFRLADMKRLLIETDKWARRRIRAVYWK